MQANELTGNIIRRPKQKITSNKTNREYIKIFLGVLLAVVIVGYGTLESVQLLRGPIITFTSPTNGTSFTEPLVEISGNAKNISFIHINDRTMYTDKAGNFRENLLLSLGYNIIKLDAQDKFGHKVSRKLELVLSNNQ